MTETSDIENFDQAVYDLIGGWFQNQGFKARKLTDTPTEALMVVNKKYADGNFVVLLAASTGVYASQEYDDGNVTGTYTLDWSKGNVRYVTMTGNTTFTFSNPISGMRCIIHFAGAFTPTLPGTVRYPAGTTPSWTASAGKKDIVGLIYSAKESLYDVIQTANFATT